jgi:hypothetical protein
LKSAGLFRLAVEPSMPFDFQQLANFRLARGSHKQPNKGGNICVNEVAVIAAGFQYREIRDVSCLPDCFSIAAINNSPRTHPHNAYIEKKPTCHVVKRARCGSLK